MVPSTKRSHAYHRALAFPYSSHILHLVASCPRSLTISMVTQKSWFSPPSRTSEILSTYRAVGRSSYFTYEMSSRSRVSDVGVVLLPVISQRLHQMQCRVLPFYQRKGASILMDFSVHFAQHSGESFRNRMFRGFQSDQWTTVPYFCLYQCHSGGR